MRDTEREGQRHRQRQKQAPRREPDAGLDPGTPGSRPEPKAGAQPLSPTPKDPLVCSLYDYILCLFAFSPVFLFRLWSLCQLELMGYLLET